MNLAAIQTADAFLASHRRVRWLVSDEHRYSVARIGVQAYDRGWRGDDWADEVAIELEQNSSFSPLVIWIAVNFLLPLLLKWLIENWTTA